MKFVKRISLFFIYPLFMFSVGFICNMLLMEFFYPNDSKTDTGQVISEVELQSVIQNTTPVITANTSLTVQIYDAEKGYISEEVSKAPDKYIGMDRERLYEEINQLNQTPSLAELEKGFSFIELYSFSPEKVIIKKTYSNTEKEDGFFLVNEDNFVVVYKKDLQNVYIVTDIKVNELPESMQKEIIGMKYLENEKELFNFLESYSS